MKEKTNLFEFFRFFPHVVTYIINNVTQMKGYMTEKP